MASTHIRIASQPDPSAENAKLTEKRDASEARCVKLRAGVAAAVEAALASEARAKRAEAENADLKAKLDRETRRADLNFASAAAWEAKLGSLSEKVEDAFTAGFDTGYGEGQHIPMPGDDDPLNAESAWLEYRAALSHPGDQDEAPRAETGAS